jgi:hypothetical protein
MRSFDLRRFGPVLLIVVLVVTPLAIWAATSGGSNDEGADPLIVERSVGLAGEPELIISLGAQDAQVSSSSSTVQVKCEDGAGKTIIDATQPWPFVSEPGYDYAHVHQAADADKVEQARRCRVLGTNKKLEAEVK